MSRTTTQTDAATRRHERFAELVTGADAAMAWVALHGSSVELNGIHVYPSLGAGDRVQVNLHCATSDQLAAATRLLVRTCGPVTKDYRDDYLDIHVEDDGIRFKAWATRESVCELVEVGTETVEIPDPDAPLVTVTRPVTEWRCHPVLAGPPT